MLHDAQPKPPLYVTGHAVDRYRIHHPEATWRDVLDALSGAERVDPGVVAAITRARRRRSGEQSYYRCGPGIFVVDDQAPDRGSVITYLRLATTQQKILDGGGAAPGAEEMVLEPQKQKALDGRIRNLFGAPREVSVRWQGVGQATRRSMLGVRPTPPTDRLARWPAQGVEAAYFLDEQVIVVLMEGDLPQV